MSTAEYVVGTFAAVSFAVVLWRVLNSAAVYSALSGTIDRALSALVITGTAAW